MNVHEKLVAKWNASEFGVKTRVFNEYSQQQIAYILSHPKYSDVEKMQDIMICIEEKALEVKEEIEDMYNTIENI